MSRGNDLQEMEVGTAQSKSAVNAGAKAQQKVCQQQVQMLLVYLLPATRCFLRRSRWSITR